MSYLKCVNYRQSQTTDGKASFEAAALNVWMPLKFLLPSFPGLTWGALQQPCFHLPGTLGCCLPVRSSRAAPPGAAWGLGCLQNPDPVWGGLLGWTPQLVCVPVAFRAGESGVTPCRSKSSAGSGGTQREPRARCGGHGRSGRPRHRSRVKGFPPDTPEFRQESYLVSP